jgi:CRP/FNR family cyclic AMP-dependent transcriptional regulator
MLSPGEFFGHKCLAGQTHRVWTVTALADGVLVRIEKSAMLRLIHTHQSFSDLFMAHILKHTVRVEASLIDQLFNSSERRLARLLLQMANYGKQDGAPEPVMIKITQETLAEMIGTTRSRVSFFMNRFRKLGYIDYDGQIHVHKSLINVLIQEPPHGRGEHPHAAPRQSGKAASKKRPPHDQ